MTFNKTLPPTKIKLQKEGGRRRKIGGGKEVSGPARLLSGKRCLLPCLSTKVQSPGSTWWNTTSNPWKQSSDLYSCAVRSMYNFMVYTELHSCPQLHVPHRLWVGCPMSLLTYHLKSLWESEELFVKHQKQVHHQQWLLGPVCTTRRPGYTRQSHPTCKPPKAAAHGWPDKLGG